jgi:inorganic phosphate transporter, PiT family
VFEHLTPVLVLALGTALAFAFTNGLLDAALATAAPVATRAASPGRAMALAAVACLLGPILLGGAVAATVAAVVSVPATDTIVVLGAGMSGAAAWNLVAWRLHLPSSAGHALIGGLVGAALLDAGVGAVTWGPIRNGHISGALGILIGLALGVILGLTVAFLVQSVALRLLARASRRVGGPIRGGQWVTCAGLGFTIGANDGAKSAGIFGVLLFAAGRTAAPAPEFGPTLLCALALVAGMVLGGWSTTKTIGRQLFPLRSLDGLTSQGGSATVLLGASMLGVPISASQAVSSSILGVGLARRRWLHVGWQVVRRIAAAWLTTIPAAAIIAACLLPIWRLIPGG